MTSQLPVTATTAGGEAARLRAERDRFVAFAFSGADLLFELDARGSIVLATGAVAALLRCAPDALAGRRFLDIVDAADRPVVAMLLRAFAAGRRLEPMAIQLRAGGEPTPPLFLFGHHLPELRDHFFLALRAAPAGVDPFAPAPRDGHGLHSREGFTDRLVRQVEGAAPGGRPPRLSLVEIRKLAALEARLDGDVRQALLRNIARFLKAASLDGDFAAELGRGRFGVVHDRAVDMDEVGARIEQYAREADPAGEGVAVRSAAIELDRSGLSPADAGKALLFALNRFTMRHADAGALDSMAASLPGLLDQAARQVAAVRKMIEENMFDMDFQPVVELASRAPVHYEALARFRRGDIVVPTGQFIEFSEKMNLIAEFDAAMCRRVIAVLNGMSGTNPDCRLAVNVSALSLESPRFRSELDAIVGENPAAARRLIFEITESMTIGDRGEANDYLQRLRENGHTVCLDDFGTGASAFEYLRDLEVDIVKIDGSYLRELLTTAKGARLFKGMVSLCRDLEIATVAEMVEEEDVVGFLRSCGVDLGQGYLFGRPQPKIRALGDAGRAAARRFAARRRGEG